MISLRSVSKSYGPGPSAVEDLSIDVDDGELCVFVGPSGCGKTTTLKMINRLIEPSSGEIFIDGENVLTVDPVQLRRRIGYVMQQGGLFPHRRVGDNVAVVPRLLGWPKERVRARVRELLDLVGLDPAAYERRYPHELSGGERQRVGVARALGGDPPVLLMDEPFGAVDPVTRKRLQEEFLELQASLAKTVVFVTHDIEEAVTLGTRIAVFSKGATLEQYDTPREVLGHPASDFVAGFVGTDRGLQRLGVTTVEREDLTRVPLVAGTTAFAVANEQMHASGYRFAVVLDGSERPIGWVPREPVTADSVGDGDRPVADRLRPFQAAVALGSSLKDALAQMLQYDDGFVAVVDGEQYVGVLTPDDLHAAMRRSLGPPASTAS
ncbi:MAG: Glycine betaine/carnitine/choline transport ATP-binding protein OpuCA [Acidimicrobiaceae bacterium]|nr:Glycine betaine/carnitine/choline transport ATP-binding protein OpuCA [Acidimicrobiaceae bacterium]